jgi:hypothetical protein
MVQRLLHPHGRQGPFPTIKRPPDAVRMSRRMPAADVRARQTLEQGGMFAVHRNDLPAVPTGRGHHELPGHDQRFFVGQRHIFSRPGARPKEGFSPTAPTTADKTKSNAGSDAASTNPSTPTRTFSLRFLPARPSDQIPPPIRHPPPRPSGAETLRDLVFEAGPNWNGPRERPPENARPTDSIAAPRPRRSPRWIPVDPKTQSFSLPPSREKSCRSTGTEPSKERNQSGPKCPRGPGRSEDESFTPKHRFMSDSVRSDTWATHPRRAAMTKISPRPKRSFMKSSRNANDIKTPPKEPAHRAFP